MLPVGFAVGAALAVAQTKAHSPKHEANRRAVPPDSGELELPRRRQALPD